MTEGGRVVTEIVKRQHDEIAELRSDMADFKRLLAEIVTESNTEGER